MTSSTSPRIIVSTLAAVRAIRLAFSRSPTKIGLPRSAHHSFSERFPSLSSIGFIP